MAGKDDKGQAVVSLCGLTRRASEAGDLLNYLQTLDRAPEGGHIFGRLLGQRPADGYGPIAGAKITVKGPALRSTTTRDDGSYSIDGLPEGGYELTTAAPPSMRHLAVSGTTFNLRPGVPCREHTLYAATNGRIHGHVVDESGRPVSGVQIQLVFFRYLPQGGLAPATSPFKRDRTDRDGRYQFTELPSGVYTTGVNIWHGTSAGNPYEPAVARRRLGEDTFALPLGGVISLPPVVARPVALVQQPVRVLLASGRPMSHARLVATGSAPAWLSPASC